MFALEELGLAYELEAVPDGTFNKGWGSPGPTLEDDDVFVIEPAAILRHLVRRTGGKLWPSSLALQAAGDRWIDFLQRRLVRTFDTNDAAKIADKLGFLEKQLEHGQWLLGDDLTILDCLYAYLGQTYARERIPFDRFPAIAAYVARLEARPALVRANAKVPRS